MTEKQDYYETLGISQDASPSDIKRAYKRLAKEHHPDVSSHESAESRFKEINEAYSVLSDPEKREIYDRYGHAGVNGNAGANFGAGVDFGGFGDIFDMFFGGGPQTHAGGRPSAERGSDLRYDVEMTLEQSAHGLEHTIRMSRMEGCDSCEGTGAQPGTHAETCSVCHGAGQVRQQMQTILGTQIRITTCPKCHGEGRLNRTPCAACGGQGRVRKNMEKTIDIPAGVDTGMRIRLIGEGEAGLRGGPSGDLYVITHVRKHDIFERKGNDLWCEISVSFPLAALGGSIEVKTIDDVENLNIAPGTQSGEIYSLRGKGMPDPSRKGQGNLNVVIKVVTPAHLSAEQKDLLRKFATSTGEEIKEGQTKGIFERMKDAFK